MRWRLALLSEIFGSRYQPHAEIGLPDAVGCGARRRRRFPVNQPSRKRQPVWRSAGWQLMQERRHARRDRSVGLEKVAAFEQMRFAHLFALFQDQLRRAFGMLPPQLGDLPVRFAEFGNGRAPVTEDG